MESPPHRSSIDLAVRHYSSLFRLPSLRLVFILLCIWSLLSGLVLSAPLTLSPAWIAKWLLNGLSFFIITLLADTSATNLLLKKDFILNLRRMLFLSFSSNLLFLAFMAASTLIKSYFLDVNSSVKMLFLGFFAATSLRLLVVYATSFSSILTKIACGLLQPSLALALAFIVYEVGFSVTHYIIYFLLSSTFSLTSVWLYTAILDKIGIVSLGIPSLKIFRAFLADWTESVEQPFEEILEHLGEEREITVSLLAFKSKHHDKIKAIMVIPNLHPGPFKNIGSSPLPGLIGKSLESEYNCVVSVPHGISGHELDLVSQRENRKVLEALADSMKEIGNFSSKATRFFIVEKNCAKAGCQVFNGCILLTLTMAPETMEDLPLELNDIIVHKAKELGFSWAIAIDSHNSIDGPFDMERTVLLLSDVSMAAMEKASLLEYAVDSLEVGAGKIIPRDLSLKDGIGPDGISAIIVSVEGQKVAYITIDGNNMVSGLREKILLSLKDLGIECGEVFTTDTHAVNAVVLTERGYHPVGEVIDHDKIIRYVREAVIEALKSIEPAEVAWYRTIIRGIKVIGERQISELSLLTDKVSKRAKSLSIIFLLSAIILMALFILI